jgi:hypothetical protein
MGLNDLKGVTVQVPVRLDKVRNLLEHLPCSRTCVRLNPETISASCTCHFQLLNPANHAALIEVYRQTVALLIRLRDLGELCDVIPERSPALQ